MEDKKIINLHTENHKKTNSDVDTEQDETFLTPSIQKAEELLDTVITHGLELVKSRKNSGSEIAEKDGGITLLSNSERMEVFGAVDRLVSLGRLAAMQKKGEDIDETDLEGIEEIFKEYENKKEQ